MLILIFSSRIDELANVSRQHELADDAHKIFASPGRRDQAVRKRHRLEQIVRLAKANPTLSNINDQLFNAVSSSTLRRPHGVDFSELEENE